MISVNSIVMSGTIAITGMLGIKVFKVGIFTSIFSIEIVNDRVVMACEL